MTFYKISSPEPAAKYIANVISTRLGQNHKVLWLVPGGSSIAVAVRAAQFLQQAPLKNLTVTLTDERYGQPGHADSNWLQLHQAGFALPTARLLPVLSGKGIEETTEEFTKKLENELASSSYRIGLFGLGADGHTAGILPGSPAVDAPGFAVSYDAGEFKRITMTSKAIAKLDEAAVYAISESKRSVLDSLEKEVQLNEQPAQALKQVNRLRVYNDYKGEDL